MRLTPHGAGFARQRQGKSALTMNFTADDYIHPIYCIGCRSHVPLSLSNQGQGYCPTCLASIQAQQAQAQQAQAAQFASQQQAQQAQQAAIFHYNTGLGSCPQCHSPNIQQGASTARNGSKNGLVSAGGLLMLVGICIWPLFIIGVILAIVGFCLPKHNVVGTSRQCGYCGFRWLC